MTTSALAKLSNTIRSRSLASSASASSAREHAQLKDAVVRQIVEEGAIRDGRIDTVAGNGAMSELGAGVETPLSSVQDEREVIREEKMEIVGPRTAELVREASKSLSTSQASENALANKEREMERLPVVVIKG